MYDVQLPTGTCSEPNTVPWEEYRLSATIWTHSYITALMMGTEMVPETFVAFNELTQLIVREDFINVKVVEVVSFIYKV
jgi:hypothetical protein